MRTRVLSNSLMLGKHYTTLEPGDVIWVGCFQHRSRYDTYHTVVRTKVNHVNGVPTNVRVYTKDRPPSGGPFYTGRFDFKPDEPIHVRIPVKVNKDASTPIFWDSAVQSYAELLHRQGKL